MTTRLVLGEISIDVLFKDIKNVHLSVLPPVGRVRIAAPARMRLDAIRLFAISKLDWIKRKQRKFREQVRETPREYVHRESHYLWGKRYLLTPIEGKQPPTVEVAHDRLFLRCKPGASERQKQEIVVRWYREQLKAAVPALIASWAPLVGVVPEKVYVQRMKTRWGSCNPRARSIRLNTELAKKPKECLAYVVAHEMTHMLEPTHNARFIAAMDRYMPNWRSRRDQLNDLPVCHEEWGLCQVDPGHTLEKMVQHE
jgi:predicted metal-dependent hydrolase